MGHLKKLLVFTVYALKLSINYIYFDKNYKLFIL